MYLYRIPTIRALMTIEKPNIGKVCVGVEGILGVRAERRRWWGDFSSGIGKIFTDGLHSLSGNTESDEVPYWHTVHGNVNRITIHQNGCAG